VFPGQQSILEFKGKYGRTMKAGILTLFQADSYGAVLQSYGLQQTLLQLGVESELVKLPSRQIIGPARRFVGIEAAKPLMKLLQKGFEKRSELFQEFRNALLSVSVPFSPEDRDEINNSYDLFIAGSDQVWNIENPDVDERYFLTFADSEKKYSYAASFGKPEPGEKEAQVLRTYLSDFQRISVRERSGQEIVKTLLDRQATLCLDPVFLLNRSDWEKISVPAESDDYLLVYMLYDNERMIEYAKTYAAEHGLRVRYVTEGFNVKLGMTPWNTVGVLQWLGLIRKAKVVVTNSYHGVAFSIIFERPFCFFRLEGQESGRNDRINNLVDVLGISTKHFSGIAEEDWDRIGQNLCREKESSLGYLEKIVRANEQNH